MKKISFPTIPEWTQELRFYDSPGVSRLIDTWLPYGYIEITPPLDLLETVQIIEYYNDILRRFFKDLDDRNRADTWETYAGLLSEEGGAGLVIFSDDGYVHPHYKVYFHHAPIDRNVMGYSGIVFANHTDQRGRAYGVLKLIRALSIWLSSHKIYHRIILRRAEGKMSETEVNLPNT